MNQKKTVARQTTAENVVKSFHPAGESLVAVVAAGSRLVFSFLAHKRECVAGDFQTDGIHARLRRSIAKDHELCATLTRESHVTWAGAIEPIPDPHSAAAEQYRALRTRISQVEHDPEAAAVLVTPSAALAQKVVDLIVSELPHLPRREIIESALSKYSAALVVESLDEAVDFANLYAAEHLQIVTKEPFAILPRIRHAGSIFLGPYAPVPVGDYASGTNHVLPTGGCARMFSGLSVDDFIKKPTFQHLSREALANLKDTVITLAENEGLLIHARAVAERFRYV